MDSRPPTPLPRERAFVLSRTSHLSSASPPQVALITYMRTDSTNLSDVALEAAEKEIGNTFGSEYAFKRTYASKSKGAQEAHEAIRPTDLSLDKIDASREEQRLYELIYKRTLASQMADAIGKDPSKAERWRVHEVDSACSFSEIMERAEQPLMATDDAPELAAAVSPGTAAGTHAGSGGPGAGAGDMPVELEAPAAVAHAHVVLGLGGGGAPPGFMADDAMGD